jgi:hypothetical protein
MATQYVRVLLVFFSLFVARVNSIQAATVSILVVEIGSMGNTDNANLWETGIMDTLFDTGHIVSNAPMIHIPYLDDKEMPAEARRDFEEADRNGVDYFIIAELSYLKIEKPGTERPYQVALKLYRTRPYSVLYTNKYQTNPDTPMIEELSNAKNAALTLIPYMRGNW